MVEILDVRMVEAKSGVGEVWANEVGRLNTGYNCVLCGSDDVDLHHLSKREKLPDHRSN